MGASTSLAAAQLSVTPGDSANCTVHVRNSGLVVDQFSVDIVGDTRSWAEVETPVVNLMPGQAADVTITFRPPRDPSVRAGERPFGVRVLSREEPNTSRVEESTVHVEPFTDVQLDLAPKTSSCRRKAKHEVVVDNLGNHPVGVELVPVDDDGELKFALEHQALTVEPGTTAFVKMSAQPETRFLRGPDRRYPFAVSAAAGRVPTMSVDGTVVQKQLLPRWLLPALLALLVALAALVALWFAVLKPTVQSAAREAGERAALDKSNELAAAAVAAQEKAASAQKEAVAAQKGAVAAQEKVAKAIKDGGAGPKPVTGPGGVDIAGGTSFDMRIATDTPKNGTTFATFGAGDAIPANKTLVVSDIVFQNAAGDGGRLQLRRGETVLLEVGLENFRDLDYHLSEPLVFPPGKRPVVAVNCTDPDAGNCKPAVSFSGRLVGKKAGE